MLCPACSAENGASRRFCRACGASLAPVCPACRAPNDPGDRFCGQCGARLGDASAPPPPGRSSPAAAPAPPAASTDDAEERRWVSVLFADLVGFTALSERFDSEQAREIVTACLRRLVAEVQRFDGTVEKFIGDAVMAVWGAPVAHEDDPERALRAALGMQRAVEDLNDDLEPRLGLRLAIRVGIQSGEVVAGTREVGDIRTFSVSGDAVNVAARLQAVTEPGSILVGDATVQRVRGDFAFEPVAPLALKNRTQPVPAARLIGEAGPGTGQDLLRAPWVGRVDELATLERCVADVRQGRGQVAVVVGEPGLGKSRLLSELRARAGFSPARPLVTWVRAQALAHEQGGSYALTRRLVDELRRLRPAPSPEDPAPAGERPPPASASGGAAPDDEAVLAHLAGLSLDGDAARRLAALSPQEVQRLLFDAVARLVAERAAAGPLVLELDDLHWADPSSVDLVLELAGLTERLPLLLLGAFRPERESPAWTFREWAARSLPHRSVEVVLAPLSEADSRRLTAALLHVEALPPELSGVLERAAGTPLWLEELVRTLVERGLVTRNGDGWTVTRDLAEVEIPDTLQKLLVARIDRLGEARTTLQTASVIGRRFRLRVLERVSGEGAEPRVAGHLREAERVGLVRELAAIPEREYAFKHVLTQEAAYATLLVRRRRELHRAVAEALLVLDHDRLDELAPTLAHHYAEAEAWPEALVYARRAAELARSAYANREAVAQYGLALKAAEGAAAPTGDRLLLLEARAAVHEVLGGFEPAREDLEAALDLARSDGDRSAEARLLGGLGMLWGGHRDYARGLSLTEASAEVAARAGQPREEAEARVRVGVMRVNLAQLAEARPPIEAALALFEGLGDARGQARVRDALAMIVFCAGQNQEAARLARQAVEELRRVGDRPTEASALALLAMALGYMGDPTSSDAIFGQSLALSTSMGARAGEAYVRGLTAELHVPFGAYEVARREATAGVALARELHHREWTVLGLSALGSVHRVMGDLAGGRRLHDEMTGICRELGSALWLADALSQLGQDLMALGERQAGLAHLQEAVATGGDALKFTVGARLALVEAPLEDGQPEEALVAARRFLAAAYEFPVFAAGARCVEGRALAALGQAVPAEALLRQVQAEARSLGASPPEWEASLALADLLASQRRPLEAAAERGRAREILERVAAGVTDSALRRAFEATPLLRRARQVDA